MRIDGREEQLINKIQKGDFDAFSELSGLYKKLIVMKTHKCNSQDREDLMQEGYLGLFLAAQSYRPDKGAVFGTYANVCIQNQIISAIRRNQSRKNLPLNTALELDEVLELSIEADGNPQDLVELRGNYQQFIQGIRKLLTPLEYNVLLLYLDDVKRANVCLKAGITQKTYDNALLRVRRKLREFVTDFSE